jgi:chemotaxis signal transduction protein
MNAEKAAQETGSEQIHVLIFELDGQLYGVDVSQVDALVEGPSSQEQEETGAWAYQGQEVPLRCLASWIGLESPEVSPSRVLLSRDQGSLQGFLVDIPKDMVSLRLDDVYPVPVLIRRVLGPSALWGVGRSAGGLVLLVDLRARA